MKIFYKNKNKPDNNSLYKSVDTNETSSWMYSKIRLKWML